MIYCERCGEAIEAVTLHAVPRDNSPGQSMIMWAAFGQMSLPVAVIAVFYWVFWPALAPAFSRLGLLFSR